MDAPTRPRDYEKEREVREWANKQAEINLKRLGYVRDMDDFDSMRK